MHFLRASSKRPRSPGLAVPAVLLGALLAIVLPGPRLAAEDLPDLVITDIYVAPTPQRLTGENVVFVGAILRNLGRDMVDDVVVSCRFACRGESERHFGGVAPPDRLAGGVEFHLFHGTPLDMDGCYFSSRRQFTCTADEAGAIRESNEANNALSRMLATGR